MSSGGPRPRSQPRLPSSLDMRRSIRSSATRPPVFILASAMMPGEESVAVQYPPRALTSAPAPAQGRKKRPNSPRGVRFLTLLRKRSPELTDCSWGKRLSRRSLWVPFPTPGAPTRMMRAARLSCMSVPRREGKKERGGRRAVCRRATCRAPTSELLSRQARERASRVGWR